MRAVTSRSPDAAGDVRYIEIVVRDSGTGIPAGVIDKIFEPFFTTKSSGNGSGLGLSMVSGFAARAGGEVTVESELGRGTAFAIRLPEVGGPIPRDPASGSTCATAALAAPGSKDRRDAAERRPLRDPGGLTASTAALDGVPVRRIAGLQGCATGGTLWPDHTRGMARSGRRWSTTPIDPSQS